jgi:hypothetical protein
MAKPTIKSQLKALGAETLVAACSALTVKMAAWLALARLGLDPGAFAPMITLGLIPFPLFVILAKTSLAEAVGHRGFGVWFYIGVAQATVWLQTSMLLELAGECWKCGGNLQDAVFYGLALGLAYGLVYALFSRIFSINVDSFAAAV